MTKARVHATADVSPSATIGDETSIWNYAQIREDAHIGPGCVIGTGAYIDFGVEVGARCKIQNHVSVFHGFKLEDGVFLGPGVLLLNDKLPRAINVDGSLKSAADWTAAEGRVCEGAAVGGGSVILPGVTVGRYAMVGAGAVVTRNIPAHGLVYGNPARLAGYVCFCGSKLPVEPSVRGRKQVECGVCGSVVELSA